MKGRGSLFIFLCAAGLSAVLKAEDEPEHSPTPKEVAFNEAGYKLGDSIWHEMEKFIRCPSPKSVRHGIPDPEAAIAEIGPVIKNFRNQFSSAFQKMSASDPMKKLKCEDTSSVLAEVKNQGNPTEDASINAEVQKYKDKYGVTLPNVEKFPDLANAISSLMNLDIAAVACCEGRGDANLKKFSQFIGIGAVADAAGCHLSKNVADSLYKQWQQAWKNYAIAFSKVYQGYTWETRKKLCRGKASVGDLYNDKAKHNRVEWHYEEPPAESPPETPATP